MASAFKVLGFVVIWGCTFGATYLVWTNFGVIAGVIFFLFGAGLAGALGMFVVLAIAKLFGVNMDD